MPAYTLSKPTSTRAMQYAIFKEAAYTRTTPEYEPIQYGVFTKTNANIVVAPVAPKSPAAFGGGSVQYWPSWIGIASWMR